MSCLVLVAPQQEHLLRYHSCYPHLHLLLTKKMNYFEDKGHSVARFSALIAKYFNDYTIDYELSSLPEFIVYEFHDSLVMKLID